MADPRQVAEFAKRIFKDRQAVSHAASMAADRMEGSEIPMVLEGFGGPEETELPTIGGAPDVPAQDLREGANVLADLDDMNPDDMTPEQQFGLEAIILLYGRPALLVQDDDFGAPGDQWAPKLDPKRAEIKELITRVGRVDLKGHPTFPWVGTGFLVAPDVIMTNRHVAVTFIREKNDQYSFLSGVSAKLDYKEEYQRDVTKDVKIVECIGIHDTYDLALLRLAESDAAKTPLRVAAEKPPTTKDYDVVVIGYPAFDSRNDPKEMVRIFNNIFNVKRLQPGTLTGLSDLGGLEIVGHDASTLGGNSGSAVIDFDKGQVVGLHFGGRYLEGNNAVPLWKLVDDPLLKKANVNFA
jgi:hypothetical protein